MNAIASRGDGITREEWANLPETFSAKTAAQAIGKTERFCTNHAEELGAVKVGGVWFFSRARLMRVLHISE